MSADNIILGEGVFSVNDVDIALTRGGGVFSIEREYRLIEADMDKGPVIGRVRLVRSSAKLSLNALELLPSNLTKFYPAMTLTDATVKDVLTAAADIVAGDFTKVTWTGTTKAGKEVYIELTKAINLENLEWNLLDKDEIVPQITYTAAYTDGVATEPWKVEFVKDNAFDINFVVIDSVADTPIEGAIVVVDSASLTTGANGVAVAKNKAAAAYAYTVDATGYTQGTGTATVVDDVLYVIVSLVASL